MGCCGGKRRSVYGDARPRDAYRRPSSAVYFEYVGEKAMTVIGSVSGRRYRFASPGAVVAVDSRDGPAIAAVPGLRRVNR